MATDQGVSAMMPGQRPRVRLLGRCFLPAAYSNAGIGRTPSGSFYNQRCQAPTF
ncbi:hypothetical protein GCM10027404_22430 [Arthrobacter tumbae]